MTLVFVGLLGFHSSLPARVVAQEPKIPTHNLRCDNVFSCPKEIENRVDFWISVFRTWKKNNKVIHDSNKPERVYMVLETEDECSRKKPKGEVRWAQNTVKKRLRSYASLISSGASKKVLKKHRYYKLFPNANLKEVQEAVKSIRCQSGNRELFTQALIEYQNYKPYVAKALKQQNLPADIQYLPFVESSYNPKAYSFAGAAGMWQIMPRTARSLGLQIGTSVDERFEPEFATLAAAKYFRNSIDRLTKTAEEGGHSTRPADINPFVITSYNYGVRGMQRAIDQVGTDYIRLLNEYKSRSFRTAVRNFYASFLAARYVAQNNDRYFPELALQNTAQKVDRIVLPKPLLASRVSSALRVDKQVLKKLNPALTYRVWENRSALPTGFVIKVPYKSSGWKSEINRLKRQEAHTQGRGDSGNRHKVRSGQTACGIAQRYKVRCRDLISLNKLGRKAVIRIGQRLKIPGGVQEYRKTKIVKSSQELIRNLGIPASELASKESPALRKPIKVESKKTKAITTASSDVRFNYEKVLAPKKQPKINLNKVANLETKVFSSNGKYWVKVLPSESLGLYSDWLKSGSTRVIRRMNRIKNSGRINVFQKVYLPIKSQRQAEAFTLSRNEYHLNIELQYFEKFEIVSISAYRPRSDETIWSIAKNNGIPMWLLMQYNKRLLRDRLVRVPEVRKKRT